jgi:hypothetical protein
MIALALTLACIWTAQAQDGGPQALDAVAIVGDAELSPAAAYDSARVRAEDHVRDRWRERAQRVAAESRPFWLPEPLVERAVGRWLLRPDVVDGVHVVDRQDHRREHDFGSSYQTTLWVAEDEQAVSKRERQLRRELGLVERRAVLTAGGTAVFWALLAMVLGWIDRLSCGYMTGRLRLIGLLVGCAVPTVAFLL